jgi:RNA polymerase sigma factor (sigma-70 family)
MVRVPEDWIAVLRALLDGDRVAQVKVTNVITGLLTRYGAYNCRDSWDDLCQEVMITLIRSGRRNSIREPRAFIAYTATVTRNKLRDWIRRERKPDSKDLWDRLQAEVELRDPDLLLDLECALESLSEKQRLVVEAVYLQGHTYEAAAELLGMPLGTLKRVRTQGLMKLREEMGVARKGMVRVT